MTSIPIVRRGVIRVLDPTLVLFGQGGSVDDFIAKVNGTHKPK